MSLPTKPVIASAIALCLIPGLPVVWRWMVREGVMSNSTSYATLVFISFVCGAMLQWWVNRK